MLQSVSLFEIAWLVLGILVPFGGGILAGMKWVDRKNVLHQKDVRDLRNYVDEHLKDITSNQVSYELKAIERFATWQAFKEFKDDLRDNIDKRFDRHERLTDDNFKRMFKEIQSLRGTNHA